MKKTTKKPKFVWIDMEMTGLNPAKDKILEIAMIITDHKLNVLEKFETITIHHDLKKIKYNFTPGTSKKMLAAFKKSGLLDRVKNSKITTEKAERLILKRIRTYCEKQNCYLAGNSVWRDKIFMEFQMPKVNRLIHYRNIDVTTLKLLRMFWYPRIKKFPKKDLHDATEDILESINQLKYLKQKIFK